MKIATVHHLRETHVPENTTEVLPVDNSFMGKIRKQAYENALTLFVIVVFFLITWVLLLLSNWRVIH